MRKGNGF